MKQGFVSFLRVVTYKSHRIAQNFEKKMEMQWWYLDRENNQHGPLSTNAVAAKYVNGHIEPTTLVRTTGSGWSNIEDIHHSVFTVSIEDGAAGIRSAASWSYMDMHGNERGPVSDAYIQRYMNEGWFGTGTKVRMWGLGWTSLQLLLHMLPLKMYSCSDWDCEPEHGFTVVD